MTYKEYYLSLNSIDAIKFAAESDIKKIGTVFDNADLLESD